MGFVQVVNTEKKCISVIVTNNNNTGNAMMTLMILFGYCHIS